MATVSSNSDTRVPSADSHCGDEKSETVQTKQEERKLKIPLATTGAGLVLSN